MITRLIPIIKTFKPCHFSQAKKYAPVRPLTEERNLLYMESYFRSNPFTKKKSFFMQFVPATLAGIANYFMGWNLVTGGIFSALLFGGMMFNIHLNKRLSKMIWSLEVSPDMKKFYVVIQNLEQYK